MVTIVQIWLQLWLTTISLARLRVRRFKSRRRLAFRATLRVRVRVGIRAKIFRVRVVCRLLFRATLRLRLNMMVELSNSFPLRTLFSASTIKSYSY